MRTVDFWGNWTPFNTLEEYKQVKEDELCLMDKIAIAVLMFCGEGENQYKIKTSLTNISDNIFIAIDDLKDCGEWDEYGEGLSEDEAIAAYITDNGLISFDYEL